MCALPIFPGECPRPVEGVAVMMFVAKIQKLCLRRCDNVPEGNPRDLTRWNHQVISEREDRVENGPDRVRKWSAIPKGSRRADSPPPTHETSPVGLVLRIGGDQIGRAHV